MMNIFKKNAENTISETQFDVFWMPMTITFLITILIVIFNCILQYNVSDDSTSNLVFYRIGCGSYIFLVFARTAESLVPTTMTFVLTSTLANEKQHDHPLIVKIILGIVLLGLIGVIYPTSKNKLMLIIFMILIYVVASYLLYLLYVMLNNGTLVRAKKAEYSDGKMF